MSTTSPSIGTIASTVSSNFSNLAKLITAGSYLAGFGFSIGAIMKFKQHKDNPTQIPVGTPIALDLVSAAALYLPSAKAAAEKAGVSASSVKAAAGNAGITSSDVSAAEAAAKAQLS